MKIDMKKCKGCLSCHPYCTVEAIHTAQLNGKKKSEVDQDACVECGACLRSEICPEEAIFQPELAWPRILRAQFSNPYAGHAPGLPGAKGSADMKQNDLTGRVESGTTKVAVEMGRPGVSTTFTDVEKVCMAAADVGVKFVPTGSVTGLMTDITSGKLKEDIMGEKGLHVMIEFYIEDDRLHEALEAIKNVSSRVETVFSLSLVNRVKEGGSIPTVQIAEQAGFTPQPNLKTNLGLGRSPQ